MKLAVVSAGLSQPSSTRLLADRLAAAAVKAERMDVETIDLRGHAHNLVDAMLSGFPSQDLKPVLEGIAEADGLIAVAPTYASSYSGLFKSFVDVLDEGVLAGKPVLIGATGGTARHSLVLDYALRPLFTYLKAIVVPTGVYVASEDWASTTLAARIDKAAGELVREMAGREKTVVADPFTDPVSFEDLLAGQ